MRKLKIDIDAFGRGEILANDVPLGSEVAAVTVRATAGEIPQVEVELTPGDLTATLQDADITIAGADWKLITEHCATCKRSWTDAHHARRELPPPYCPDGHGPMQRTQQALVPAGPEIPA